VHIERPRQRRSRRQICLSASGFMGLRVRHSRKIINDAYVLRSAHNAWFWVLVMTQMESLAIEMVFATLGVPRESRANSM
jgi:hypothetical protein